MPPPFQSMPSMRPHAIGSGGTPFALPSSFARKTSQAVLLLVYVVAVIAFALALWLIITRHQQHSMVAFTVAGFAVAIAAPLSFFDMNAHWQGYTSPLQRHYIRILGIVPFYAAQSWFSLVYKEQHLVLATFREWYLAFGTYAFFHLCVEFLGGMAVVTAHLHRREAAAKRLSLARARAEGATAVQTAASGAAIAVAGGKQQQQRGIAHTAHAVKFREPRRCMPAPLCCLRAWRMNEKGSYMRNVAYGVEQYVILRAVLAVVSFAAAWGGKLCEGAWMAPDRCA